MNLTERIEARKLQKKPTVVKTYKGDKELERGLASMQKLGYRVDSRSTRKAAFSAAAGVFTRKQMHTIVFTKAAADAA